MYTVTALSALSIGEDWYPGRNKTYERTWELVIKDDGTAALSLDNHVILPHISSENLVKENDKWSQYEQVNKIVTDFRDCCVLSYNRMNSCWRNASNKKYFHKDLFEVGLTMNSLRTLYFNLFEDNENMVAHGLYLSMKPERGMDSYISQMSAYWMIYNLAKVGKKVLSSYVKSDPYKLPKHYPQSIHNIDIFTASAIER